jgi:hypothetical protein
MQPRARHPQRPRRLPACAAAHICLLLLAGLAVAAVGCGSHAKPAPPIVPSDRTLKANMVEALAKPPQVIIFGGSRALRFEPSYIQKKTGLTGFNAAFSNGRAEDAWAWTNYLHHQFPHTRLRFFWPLQVEAFREQGLAFGLIQDKRFSQHFPPDFLVEQSKRLPQDASQLPDNHDLATDTYGPDGALLHNRYDIRLEKGGKLSTALDWSIRTMGERYARDPVIIDPRARMYFEKTLGLMNKLGATPVLVLMPIQPRVLAAIKPLGWSERHRVIVAYLKSLQKRYRFTFFDFSELSSVGGDPKQYYDGVHMWVQNTRRVIDAVLARDPNAFK